MQYFSTRNASERTSPSLALLTGLAPDGGLYVPEVFKNRKCQRLNVYLIRNLLVGHDGGRVGEIGRASCRERV